MSTKAKVITGGKQVELQGSLPGERTTKGERLSIPVDAFDGKHRKEIILTKKIGEGGEGSVFETNLGQSSGYVAKIYLREKLTDVKCAKLELMISKDITCEGVCFPVALIKNEKNETVGFLMPRARGYELGKSVFLPKLLQVRFPSWTRRETIQLCLTILGKIKYLNDRDIILGDINGQNILVASPTEVYFVDCDSYQIGNYPCPTGTAHFTPPEAQGRSYETFLRTQAMENFAIATLLFMIMLPGKSPYSAVGGTDPAENIRQGNFPYESDDSSKVPPGKWGFIWSHMSYNTRRAFVETFRKGGDNFEPEKRMNAGEWIEVFEKYKHGINYMLEKDRMAMDLFPTRPKLRTCKKCGKRYIPKPDRHMSLCDDCYKTTSAWRRDEERRRMEEQRALHEKRFGQVWKRYPCKNPKCNNIITLYTSDQIRYRNKRLPEYCPTCWIDVPCKKCGYVAKKWMHDERDGLCGKCYTEERRRVVQGSVHSPCRSAATSTAPYSASARSVATSANPQASSVGKDRRASLGTSNANSRAKEGQQKAGQSVGCLETFLIWFFLSLIPIIIIIIFFGV